MPATRVLCVGFCGVDYLGTVSCFPSPDDKIRTESLVIAGGGNAGNTACCIGKLAAAFKKDYMSSHHEDYLECVVLTKIGDDAMGQMVKRGLEDFYVNTDRICVSSTSPTGFVYVIVDKQTATRTCIATPSEELTESEVDAAVESGLLDGVTVIHFDSRHTAASLHLARKIGERSVVTTIDVEKDRPYLRDLLPYIDIIFASERFARLYFADSTAGEIASEELHPLVEEPRASDLFDRLHLLTRLLDPSTRVKCVVSTLGAEGSICVSRSGSSEASSSSSSVFSFSTELQVRKYTYKVIRAGAAPELYDVLLCPAAKLRADEILDTTGAGDVYIGGYIYGYADGRSREECMRLATSIAAEKLRHTGARLDPP